MPSPKAYGIHIAKMSEAFVSLGYHLTLVVPLRSSQEPLQEFYGLRTAVPVAIGNPLWSFS